MHRSTFHRALVALFLSVGCFSALAPLAEAAAVAVATVGQTVTFSAACDGAAPFSYQWYKNDVPVAGATQATLVLGNVALGATGTYHAVVSNRWGNITSDRATLTVAPALLLPVIATPPAARTVAAGSAVTFSVVATGTPAPTYQWRKNGTAIAGATAASYTIASAGTAQAGTYSVVVTNAAGSVTSSGALLTISGAPVITTQPVKQTTLAPGGSVTFSVVASGTPAPTYQWRKNGKAIAGATAKSYTVANATTSDAGTYAVVVANAAGSVTSGWAVLTINSIPVITSQPAGKSVIAGSNVTFAVTATGTPAPTYQWRKDGVALSGATGSSYTLSAVTYAQGGAYSVVVKNSAGSVTSASAVLEVNLPLPAHADFNGDGKSDILWQNILTGQHRLWLMNGSTRTSVVTLDRQYVNWDNIGVEDFDGDGQNDLLRQNLVTRECAIWVMNGTVVGKKFSLGVSLDMLIAGTGDFNADGLPDILWQNVVTGAYTIRFMDGITVKSTVSIGAGPVGWTVGGAGDFNGDGQTDILWQRVTDGAARVWLMNNGTYVREADLGARGLNWVVGGTGDFNGDGKVDILWQNTVTGLGKVALMSGLTKTGEVDLGTEGSGWFMEN